MGIIFGVLLSGCVLGILGGIIAMWWLSLDIYFLMFPLQRHPVLRAMVQELAETICKEEGIRVYDKSFETLNADVENDGEKALGTYIYTLNPEYQQKVNESLQFIEELELKYKLPYKEVCVLLNAKSKCEKEEFVLPRIYLCTERLMKYGVGSYYGTYFHEIGHHFAAKTIGKHTEDDANKIAHDIILECLPYYFQLIPDFNFKYRLDVKRELSFMEKIKAYRGYLKYYFKHKDTIVKRKRLKNGSIDSK